MGKIATNAGDVGFKWSFGWTFALISCSIKDFIFRTAHTCLTRCIPILLVRAHVTILSCEVGVLLGTFLTLLSLDVVDGVIGTYFAS